MHVQPISTFRLFQEGHLLRNSIAIFVLTTLFYFIGAELRLVHELLKKPSTKKLFRYWICHAMSWSLSPVQSPDVSVTRTSSINCCLSRSTV